MNLIVANVPEGFLAQALWILETNWPLFWYGIKITLMLAFLGTIFGLVIGLVLGGLRAITIDEQDKAIVKLFKKFLHAIVNIYVWFFRGTPMMVQAMFLYYAFRSILGWSVNVAGIVIISVNTGAYMAEIIRSGIQSVDKGQMEAARSLGMSSAQTMIHIILPQAIRNSFPSIGNEFIVNIKDSSMLNVIGVIELYFQTTSVAGSMYLSTPTYFIACCFYLILTSIATIILSYTEKRLNQQKSCLPDECCMVKGEA